MQKPVPATTQGNVNLASFLSGLPEHQRDFYKNILRDLPKNYVLQRSGISYRPGPAPQSVPFCSPFRVKEQIRSPKTKNWSRVVELLDPAGDLVDCVIPEGMLTGRPRDAIGLLSDRGLRVFNEYQIRTVIELVRNWYVPLESQRTIVEGVGWTPELDIFVLTSGRIISRPVNATKYRFGGEPNGTEFGDLEIWRKSIASLAPGNPNLIFGIALGFSSALMPFTDLNTLIFHLFGRTTMGKTRVLNIALSVWPKIGSKEKTWAGTANGLEGEIAESHSILMGLDELRADATPDLPSIIYKFANGSSKARGKKEGGTHVRLTWNTAVFSTGEYSFAELVKALGEMPTGGQGVRMLDIPAEGVYGVFDNLHGFDTSDDFVVQIDKVLGNSSGPAGAAFVEQLLAMPESTFKEVLEDDRRAHAQMLNQHLDVTAGDDKTAEIRRVLTSFALVATAGEWATKWGLTGWEPGAAAEATKTIAERWLRYRMKMPSRQSEQITGVRDFIAANEGQFLSFSDARVASGETPVGFQDKEFFYATPAAFSGHFGDKIKTASILHSLLEKGYLEPGGEGKSLQYRLPSIVPGRPRVYRVRRGILSFDGNP